MKYLKVVLLKITMGSAIICTNVNATMNYEENKNFSINDSIICNNLSNIDNSNKKLIEKNNDNSTVRNNKVSAINSKIQDVIYSNIKKNNSSILDQNPNNTTVMEYVNYNNTYMTDNTSEASTNYNNQHNNKKLLKNELSTYQIVKILQNNCKPKQQDNDIQHPQLQSVKTRKNNLWTPQPNTLQSNEEFDFSNIYLKSSSDLCEVSNSRKSTNNSPIQEGKQIDDNINLPNKDTEEYSDYQILGDILKKYKKNINKIKNTNNNKKISTSNVFKDNNIQFRKNIENSIDKTNKNINNQEILDLINRNIKQKSKENKNKGKNITNRQIDSTCKKTSENLSNNIDPKIKSTCKNNDACNSKIYRIPNGSNILKEANNILEEANNIPEENNARYFYSDTHYYKKEHLMNIMHNNGYNKGNKIALDNKVENSIGKGDVAILLPNQKYYKSAEMVDCHEFKNAFVTKNEEGNELCYKIYNFMQKKITPNNDFLTIKQLIDYIQEFKSLILADIDNCVGNAFLKSSYPKYVPINDEKTIDEIAELLLSGNKNCKNLSKKILENYVRSNCKSESKSDIIIKHISEESFINFLNSIYEKFYNKQIN